MAVRTRFAPSPTGFLHVGGLRSALYNYLFARKNGGQFLLRIEDTDQARKVEGAVESLIDTFKWLHIDFDEGPHLGGPFGPYVQSQRLDMYTSYVNDLAKAGHAYPCFCSSETLDKMRADQTARSVPPMYDRRCRNLPSSEIQTRLEAGEPHVWRMAIPEQGIVKVTDHVRGEVQFDVTTIDDQVLLKSDGYPTYHMANVVDDHHMQISHVIRGEEWLPSTPKHILLYDFFGWQIPEFAHLPLLLNADRSKMSKRTGDVAVEEYRKKGFLAESLINFVALLGWHPADDRELFTLEGLVNEFSLDRVNKAGAVFDLAKLQWMNSEYIKRESDAELSQHLTHLLKNEFSVYGADRVAYAVSTLRAGADTYDILADKVKVLFAPNPPVDPELMTLIMNDNVLSMIDGMIMRLQSIEKDIWNDYDRIGSAFKDAAGEVGAACGLKGKLLWQPLRIALTGQQHGPELVKLMGIWGRERVLAEFENIKILIKSSASN